MNLCAGCIIAYPGDIEAKIVSKERCDWKAKHTKEQETLP